MIILKIFNTFKHDAQMCENVRNFLFQFPLSRYVNFVKKQYLFVFGATFAASNWQFVSMCTFVNGG